MNSDLEPLRQRLASRRSTPARQLGGAAPEKATIERMIALALRVPDHGKLQPWRVLVLHGEPRQAFSTWLMARRAAQQPSVSQALIDKDRQKLTAAPLVLVVVSRITDTARIPEIEQLLSGGCVCFSLLLAAECEGLGAQWLTGWAAYDRGVADKLGLNEHERILGFIHVGERQEDAPDRLRPALADHVQEWRP